MTDHDITDTVTGNPRTLFSAFLAEHRSGILDLELTEALREVIEAVGRHRKGGTVTLTLKFKPQGDAYVVEDAVGAKPPQPDPEGKLYWVDLDGNLTRRSPDQPHNPHTQPQLPDPTPAATGGCAVCGTDSDGKPAGHTTANCPVGTADTLPS